MQFDSLDDIRAFCRDLPQGDGRAADAATLLPVGLPFFVEPSLAPEYLIGDRPSVRLRAFGSDLHAGDAVTFTVASDSLGMAATTVSGRAFEPVDQRFVSCHDALLSEMPYFPHFRT